jgi:uncharacterized protein
MSRVVHFEIPADDPARAIKFYEDVFGWKIEKWGEFEYWLVTTGKEEESGINGAILPKKFNSMVRDAISVNSYREAVKKIENAGGKMLTEAMPVEGIGLTGAFEDTEGNQFLIVAAKE